MKRYLLIILISVFAFAAAFALPLKNAPDDKKCLECHSAVLQGKVAHKPVSQGCDACHKSNGQQHPQADVKGFTMAKEMPDLCYTCHTPLNTKQKVHAIVNNGKCMICHSAHSSENAYLIKDSPLGKICLECHDDLGLDENISKHSPVVEGKCQECHDPHQSDNKYLLKSQSTDLCVKCHDKVKEQLTMTNVHPPFKNKCTICHSSHGSDQAHLLNKPTGELCVGCHDDFEEPMQISAVVHGPLKDSRACTNCHSPHASGNDKLLLADQKSLCLSCHNKTIKIESRTLPNIKQLLAKNKFEHGAIAKNGCTVCHNPHFSDQANLLTGKFNSAFYTSSAKDSLALCFTCHNPELLSSPTTTTATSFRNGDKNLHFVHVNGPKGRSCTVCHEVHAATNKHLLHEKIPFGDWAMKLDYSEQLNGGSCQTACHAERTYKR